MFDFATVFYTAVVCSAISLVLGYYVGERGWQGVQNDLNNVKLDIANIKGKIDGPSVPQPVVVPTGVTLTPIDGRSIPTGTVS